MRVTLLHNPGSGGERHDQEDLQRLVHDAGHELIYRSIHVPGWESTIDIATDLVVAAGGDGTVRAVFKEVAARAKGPVTILPTGSANNIARTLGLDRDLAEVVQAWTSPRRARYDVCEVRADSFTTAFVESVGGGVFAESIARADDPGGEEKLDHGLRVLQEVVAEAPAQQWHVSADGVERDGDFLAVEVLNTRETGSNVVLAPHADPGDRQLDLVEVRPEHREELAEYARARLRGEDAGLDLPALRASRIAIRPPRGTPLRIDDEAWPGGVNTDQATVELSPGHALELWLP